MGRFEYIKWFVKDDKYSALFFYEVDTESERYATRMAEVYNDRSVVRVIEEGFEFITEEPVPVTDEINAEPEFYAEVISESEFEEVYNSDRYAGDISFPKKDNDSL